MTKPTICFENAVATITECLDGYAVFTYRAGPRKPSDFQAVMTHLGSLLRTREWHRILGDQRLMTPATAEESELLQLTGSSKRRCWGMASAWLPYWHRTYLPGWLPRSYGLT